VTIETEFVETINERRCLNVHLSTNFGNTESRLNEDARNLGAEMQWPRIMGEPNVPSVAGKVVVDIDLVVSHSILPNFGADFSWEA
jgi:hypothetical protein